MPGIAWVALASLAAFATVALIVRGYADERRGAVWGWKMTAATSFIVAGVAAGAADTAWGTWILIGLGLSWFGDLFLIPREGPWFLYGIIAFLLGHVGYVAAFYTRGIAWGATLGAGVGVLLAAAIVVRWLWPHVRANRPELRGPVIAYVAVISAMVTLAVGTFASSGNAAILVGAVMFYLSDLSVARDRFVAPGVVNKAWGAPLYFGGQWVLALAPLAG